MENLENELISLYVKTQMKTIQNHLRLSNCPLCKSELIFTVGDIQPDKITYYSTTQIYLLNRSELWECNQCKSSFTQNILTETDAVQLYSQGSSKERWTMLPFEKSKTSEVITKIKTLLSPNLKVLDVGCGSGNFLDFAKGYGCKTYGIEYSRSSLDILNQRGHLGFSSLEAVSETFDLVTAFDVIEHLYDIPLFLKQCQSKLTPNGYIVLLTGDISCWSSQVTKSNWWYVKYPEHIVFPSKEYFAHYSQLEIVNWTTTKHAPLSKGEFLFLCLKAFIKTVLNNRYDGYPSFAPDHYMAILKKRHSWEDTL